MPDSGDAVDVPLSVVLGLVVMDGFVRWVDTVEVPNVVREGRGVVSRGTLVEAEDGVEVGSPGMAGVEEREEEIGRLLEVWDERRVEEMPALEEDGGVGWR